MKYIKTVLLFIFAVLLTIGAAGIIYIYLEETKVEKEEENVNTQIYTPTPTVIEDIAISESSISSVIVPESNTLAINSTQDVRFSFNLGSEKVRAAELVIKYDPTKIRINSIDESDAFDVYAGKEIDSSEGFAKISGTLLGDESIIENLFMGTISITRIASGETQIKIVDKQDGLEYFTSMINIADESISPNGSIITLK